MRVPSSGWWRGLRGAVAVTAFYIVGGAVFERLAPRSWVRSYQRSANRVFRHVAGFALGWAVIETVGRRTGERRPVPVGGRLRGDVYWLVAGDDGSAFVKNIDANPQVRVRVHGRWRTGTARMLREDDPRRRLLRLNPLNSLFVAIAAKQPLTVRIDLDPR